MGETLKHKRPDGTPKAYAMTDSYYIINETLKELTESIKELNVTLRGKK